MGRKFGGSAPFWGGRAEAYLHTKWDLDPCSHLAATDMGRKLEGLCPFRGGGLGPHLTQCGQGRGLPACQVSSWSVQLFGHNTPRLQTDRTDRQRTDSIGRTVLQTVAQKPRTRYGDFSIFQDGGRRHLGFSNFGFMYSNEISFLSVRDKKLTLIFWLFWCRLDILASNNYCNFFPHQTGISHYDRITSLAQHRSAKNTNRAKTLP